MKKVHVATGPLHWKDHIPLEYRYTHGVAGERFFKSLKERGILVGSRCARCGTTYLPPRLYCPKCFILIHEWVDLPPTGTLYSYTIVRGRQPRQKEVIGLIKFEGVAGGLVHRLRGLSPQTTRLDIPVRPVLRDAKKRTGSILDIEFFEPMLRGSRFK